MREVEPQSTMRWRCGNNKPEARRHARGTRGRNEHRRDFDLRSTGRTAEDELGPKQSCTFDDPATYHQHYVIVTTPTLAEKVDPRVQVFVNGLREAENFAKNNSEAAKQMVCDKTRLGLGQIEKMWGSYDFGVTLDDEGLKELWKDEAEWYKRKPGVPGNFASPGYNQVPVKTYLSK